MANPNRTWQQRIEAAEAALSLLDEAGVDQSRQIDVFGLCERVGLWLAFMPLDNALGAFVPDGSGGILAIGKVTNASGDNGMIWHMTKAGQWNQIAGEVSDDVVRLFAAVGRHDQIVAAIEARFGGLVDSISASANSSKPADLPPDLVQDIAKIPARYKPQA